MAQEGIFASNQSTHNKLSEEAVAKGLRLFGYSLNGPTHRQYRFESCGHLQDILTSNVRKNTPRCRHCSDKIKNETLLSLGLEFISVKSQHRSVYRFSSCGHIKEIDNSCLKNEMFECKECLHNDNIAVALSRNMEIVGDSSLGSSYKRYRFLSCNHIVDLQKSNVRTGKFYCKICKEDSLKSEAFSSCVELMGGSERGARYRKYKFQCGHVSDMKTEMVRNGVCNCPFCGETSWSKPSYTYVFRIQYGEFAWLKVGYARSLSFRKRRYGLPDGATVDEIFIKKHDTGKLADLHETEILESVKDYQIDRKVMQQYMQESGSTECFTLDALPVIEKHFR